jgi:hypothetical protein
LRQAPENHFLHRNGEKYEVFAITMEDSSFCSFLGLITAQSLMGLQEAAEASPGSGPR